MSTSKAKKPNSAELESTRKRANDQLKKIRDFAQQEDQSDNERAGD